MGVRTSLLLGSDVGHKFQPVLLAPTSYSCSQFPDFSVTSYSTKPPPPLHSHGPEAPRRPPSSTDTTLQGFTEHPCGKRGEDRITAKLLCSPSQQPLDNVSQLLPIIFKLFLNHAVSSINGAYFYFWLAHRWHKMHFHRINVEKLKIQNKKQKWATDSENIINIHS